MKAVLKCQHILTNAQYITFIFMKLTSYQIITNTSSENEPRQRKKDNCENKKKVHEVYILNRLEIFKSSWVPVLVYNHIDK